MKISSVYFGELEIPEEKIINFKEGILGFQDNHKYIFITEHSEEEANQDFETTENQKLFYWLHSVESEDLAFALLDVFKIKMGYKPTIKQQWLDMLNWEEGDEINVYNIVNIPEEIEEMTVNLAAPIVINNNKMLGMQVILEDDYGIKYRIINDLKKSDAEKGK